MGSFLLANRSSGRRQPKIGNIIRCWHLADICLALANVWSGVKADMNDRTAKCLLMTQGEHLVGLIGPQSNRLKIGVFISYGVEARRMRCVRSYHLPMSTAW